MLKPGDVVYWTPADSGAADRAREFCRTRGLTGETARIVKREGRVEVEIKKPCKLKVS